MMDNEALCDLAGVILDNDLNLLLMDIILSLMTSLRFDGVLNLRQS